MINVFDTWRSKRLIRKTQQQLHGLSDHILADIGLRRGDIPLVGRNGQISRNR